MSIGEEGKKRGGTLGRRGETQIHMSEIPTDLLPEPRIVSARTVASWDTQEPLIGISCASADGSRDSSGAHGGVPSITPTPT